MEEQERARLLTEARNRVHLTQEEAAERIGVSNTDPTNRREALRRLAILSVMALGSTATPAKVSQAQNVFNQCAAGIAACRELGKGGNAEDVALAFKGASTYLAMLRPMTKSYKTAANLAAQAARVKATLAWHVENLQQAAEYAQEAVGYAQMTDDAALIISTLISQSWVCYYDRQVKEGLTAIGNAIPVLKGIPNWRSSPIAVRVLSTLAVMEAKSGNDYDQTLVNAHKALHSSSAPDYFAYSDSMAAEIIGNEGMAYYHAGEYETAFNTFSQLIDPDKLLPIIPLSGKARIEMLNFMALSSLKSQKKDIDKTIAYWKAGLQEAQTLQSKQRLAEASHIYDTMEAVWTGEQRIQELREHTVHW